MTYEEVVEKIENIRRFGNLAGVAVSARMLEVLGNPHDGMRIIHIAGTNGKGSVSAFLCAILKEAGLKVGVFTSPHLVDFRERICINGEMIDKESVRRIGEGLLACEFGVHPTMFDYCLLMALLYFKEQQCDAVILETGIGGRLDSTNAVGTPEVSVITKIGYDHTSILGETLEEIAREKAGIIKKGTAFVAESQADEVLAVFDEAAKDAGVCSYQVIEKKMITKCRYQDGVQYFSFGAYDELKMQMLGVHQYENAAAAILAAEAFLAQSEENQDNIRESIYRGIYAAKWQGRMEVLRREPFFMLDGAHNSNGVGALKRSLMELFPDEKFHFIMGVMADKDYEEMIRELLPLAEDFTTITVESERALQAKQLAECICKMGVRAECADELLPLLLPENGDAKKKTIAFGSLYFIGEIKSLQNRYRF